MWRLQMSLQIKALLPSPNRRRHIFIYLYSEIAAINQSAINLPPHQ